MFHTLLLEARKASGRKREITVRLHVNWFCFTTDFQHNCSPLVGGNNTSYLNCKLPPFVLKGEKTSLATMFLNLDTEQKHAV